MGAWLAKQDSHKDLIPLLNEVVAEYQPNEEFFSETERERAAFASAACGIATHPGIHNRDGQVLCKSCEEKCGESRLPVLDQHLSGGQPIPVGLCDARDVKERRVIRLR
jgi:hypothetical protein